MNLPRQRQAVLRRECEAAGARRLVVYGNAWTCDSLRYATDFAPLEGHALAVIDMVGDGRVHLMLEVRDEAERARIEVAGASVEWAPAFHAQTRAAIAQSPAGLAYAPAGAMPVGLTAALAGAIDAIDFSARMRSLLMHKLDAEIAQVRRAAELADEGYDVFRHAAREGRLEYEIVADLEAFFRERGCPDNFMIMGSGGREVRAMHPPGARRLQRGDLVTTELTPCVRGYYAQICRTLVIGPASREQQRAFDVHLEALQAGLSAIRPGVTAGQVATAQNDVFRAHGLGEYTSSQYTRVRGHGLGLYVDTAPPMQEGDPTAFADGMTVIVHPNGYHPDSGYLVLGDSLVVREGGNEILTRTPRRLFVV
jgi:Xaa-Pro aminopeptidase